MQKEEKEYSEKMAKELKGIVDDSVYEVNIPTPKNWKCKRKNCNSSFKHIHSTF